MSPATRKEEYKYSTPIEGPDNQFGSAERSDDEDDHEPVTDASERPGVNNVYEFANKNKSLPQTNSINRDKLTNKVRKTMNNFEIEERAFGGENSCDTFYATKVLVNVLMIVVFTVLNNLVNIDLT